MAQDHKGSTGYASRVLLSPAKSSSILRSGFDCSVATSTYALNSTRNFIANFIQEAESYTKLKVCVAID